MADTASTLIASMALAVSVGNVVWNMTVHRLTGQHPKLTVGSIVLVAPGWQEPVRVLDVSIANHGRVPIEVTGWSVTFPPDRHLHSALIYSALTPDEFTRLGMSDGPPPNVIEPGRRMQYRYPLEYIEAARVNSNLDEVNAYVQVFFGARKPLRGPKNIAKILQNYRAKVESGDHT